MRTLFCCVAPVISSQLSVWDDDASDTGKPIFLFHCRLQSYLLPTDLRPSESIAVSLANGNPRRASIPTRAAIRNKTDAQHCRQD
jgi:hypothetical protein